MDLDFSTLGIEWENVQNCERKVHGTGRREGSRKRWRQRRDLPLYMKWSPVP